MKKSLVFVILLGVFFSITSLASTEQNNIFSEEELLAFAESKTMITAEMSSLKDIFDDIALVYPYISDDEKKIYQMLNDFINRKEYFEGLWICNNEKIITNVATSYNKRQIGLNLSQFDFSEDLFKERPSFIMTTISYYVDIPRILISNPIHQQGKITGWSVMYIDPFALSAHISSITVGQDINIGILDQAGMMVHDSDISEVGRNVLNDPMYESFEELRELLRTDLLVNRSGIGLYEFYSSGMGSSIKKHIKWETIDMFESQLRVFINSENKLDEGKTLETDFSRENLTVYKKDFDAVKRLFSNIETSVNDSIEIYLEKGLADEALNASLKEVYINNPLVRYIYFVDKENMTIQASFPAYNAQSAGEGFNEKRKKLPPLNEEPFYTSTFNTSSDYPGITHQAMGFGIPVMAQGELKGWIVGFIKIYELVTAFLNVSEAGVNVNYMLINEDGTTLYEEDIFEVGKNIYTDPLYTKSIALHTFIKDRLLTETSGSGEYEFYGVGMTKQINKKIVWDSFEFAGSRFIFSMNLE